MKQFLSLLQARGVSKPPAKDIRVLGIDLGTTNSSVSQITWKATAPAPNQVRTLEIDQETSMGRHTSTLVPSMVAIQNNRVLVGEGVKILRGRITDKTLGLWPKRNIFWECKNDIGLARTYRAPRGFCTAKEIGGHVLKFLFDSAMKEDPTPAERVVVTVPASFSVPQRQDTQIAAQLAGIKVNPGDLVDEPVAAFLDYIFSHDISRLELQQHAKNCLVFDFGGGTCDVAIFRAAIMPDNVQIQMAPLTVSRYHRLGGGDIDAAIVHEVVIPQIITQNHLTPFELDYEDKAFCIGPAFLSIAEALKIGLCKEISRLIKLGSYPSDDDRKMVFKKNPGVSECTLKDGRKLKLESPVLNALQFETLLTPFLDRDFLFARETEYRMTCSIVAPLTDALNRAGLDPEEISICLLAGSSSFIPKIQQELDTFFTNGFVLNFDSPEDAKLAISRGAAYHALALVLTGQGIVKAIASDSMFIQTNEGPEQLVPAGSPLPFPAPGQWAEVTDLKIPESSPNKELPLRLELMASDQMSLFKATWRVPPPVEKGAPLRFRYMLDENQVIRLRVNLAAAPANEFLEYKTENPLTNIEYSESKREEIELLEEEIRTGRIPRVKLPETIEHVAILTADLGQKERALSLMMKALTARGGKDSELLNRMGILCNEMQDYAKAEKFYKASAETDSSGMSLFNLALSQKRRGLIAEAVKNIEKAITHSKVAPYLVLRAMLADTQQDPMKRDACLREAMQLFGSVAAMSDWELGWYLAAADLLDDDAKVQTGKEEFKRRGKAKPTVAVDGLLPDRGRA